MEFSVTRKQISFINATEDEVLFGGAAGGGKSYAQLIDSFYYANKYPKSRQLILRRTFPELNRSLIEESLKLFPSHTATFHKNEHIWRFKNGSVIEMGCCHRDSDVVRYQSAEYDVIRFDELTHFTAYQYSYMLSRNRGANNYPKQIKSSTNPGGIGHSWVKSHFIDPAMPLSVFRDKVDRTRIFIPSLVSDNHFLTSRDPGYVSRLSTLPVRERKALLEGSWDIFDGQYFDNFDRDIHVVPFASPNCNHRIYAALDYGLDMLAVVVAAVDSYQNITVISEIYETGLLVSKAAEMMNSLFKVIRPEAIFAPPDLWGSNAETGKSIASLFARNGITLTRVSAARVAGWLRIKEALEATKNSHEISTRTSGGLVISSNCVNLIRCLPSLVRDPINPSDICQSPHEITHAPDALRYLLSGLPMTSVSREIRWSNLF